MSLRPRSALCAAVLLAALPALCGAVLLGSAGSALRSGVLTSQQAAALLQTGSRGGESEQVQEESDDMLEESEEDSDHTQVVMGAAISDEAFSRLSKHKASHWQVLKDFMNKTFADIGFITNISPRLSYDAPHGKVGGPFIEFRFPKAGCAWPKYRPPPPTPKADLEALYEDVFEAEKEWIEAQTLRTVRAKEYKEAKKKFQEKDAEYRAKMERAENADPAVQKAKKYRQGWEDLLKERREGYNNGYEVQSLDYYIQKASTREQEAREAVRMRPSALAYEHRKRAKEVKYAKRERDVSKMDEQAKEKVYKDNKDVYEAKSRKKYKPPTPKKRYTPNKPSPVKMSAQHSPAAPLLLPRLPLSPNVSASPSSPLSSSAKAEGLSGWCNVNWGSCAARTKVMAVLGYKWNAGYAIYVPIDTKALESEVGIGGWFPTIPGTKAKESTRSKWMVGFWHQHILGIDGVKGPMTLMFGKNESQYDANSKEWYPLKSNSPEIELMWRHTGKFQLGKPSSDQKNWANTHLFFFTESAESPDGRRMFFELNGTPDFSGKGNHEIGMETRSVVKNIWTDWLADKCGKKGADGWPKF